MHHIRIKSVVACVLCCGAALFAQTGTPAQEAEASYRTGQHLFDSGDYPGALRQLSRAVELAPDLPGLQSVYGQALLNTGDPDSALAAFQKAIAQDKSDFAANLSGGQILTARENYQAALPLLQKALALRSGSPAAKLAMAESLAGLNRYTEARPYAEAAVLALPASAQAHAALAAVYTGLHKTADASAEQEMAAALAPPDPGPAPGEAAPDFALSGVSADDHVRLRDFRGKRPVVLVFGSYSCPNFRSAAGTLRLLHQRYASQAEFLLVYIREAHASDNWQSTRNVTEGVSVTPPATLPEKQDRAALCSRKLHLPFHAVADSMDGKTETAYNAFPSRLFIVGVDGRVRYRTRLTELDFHPRALESALDAAIANRDLSRRP